MWLVWYAAAVPSSNTCHPNSNRLKPWAAASTYRHHCSEALSGVGGSAGAGLSCLAGSAGAALAATSTEAASRAQRTAGTTTALQADCMHTPSCTAAVRSHSQQQQQQRQQQQQLLSSSGGVSESMSRAGMLLAASDLHCWY
jgi:hypothetical protein